MCHTCEACEGSDKQTEKYDARSLIEAIVDRRSEGKSKPVASDKFFESRIFGMCKEGFGMSRSVEFLGMVFRNHSKKLVKKEKRKKCAEDWSHLQDERIQAGLHNDRYQHHSADGSDARKSLGF